MHKALIPKDRDFYVFALFHAFDGDGVVHGVQFESGALSGAGRTRRVVFLYELVSRFKIRSPGAFVSDRPIDDAGMGAISLSISAVRCTKVGK